VIDRSDTTLAEFVEEGRLAPEVAVDVSRAFHDHPVDVRQRLAELSGYAGAALATVGMIVIGSQVWVDFSHVVRAFLPALASAMLLVGSWWIVRSVSHISEHPARGRAAQVMGAVSAVLALLAVQLAFESAGEPPTGQMLVGSLVALVISLAVWRWAPGLINTSVTAVVVFIATVSLMDALGLADGPTVALAVVALGVVGSLLLARFFPPEWLTRGLGLGAWLMGTTALMTADVAYGNQPDTLLRWVGRGSATALVVLGSWTYARGGDWLWAIAAGLAAAALVGLWSLEAMSAGFALMIAGIVLLVTALVLARLRRAEQQSDPVG
jgi:hypothetical protein